jgi:hypothetical protein
MRMLGTQKFVMHSFRPDGPALDPTEVSVEPAKVSNACMHTWLGG